MKNKVKRIGIIGHFGGNENFMDGQTVKTKVLYDELNKTGMYDIVKVDTYLFKKSKVKLILDTLRCLLGCNTVFLLVSAGGMRVYFPLLYYWNKIFKTRVIHDVIGGNLHKYVRDNKNYKRYLNSFYLNLVESRGIVKGLEEAGVTNAQLFPNFKRLKKLNQNDIKEYNDEIYKFCTFSRVIKEKGIEDAVKTVEKINADAGKKLCTVDIYGVVEERYKEEFEELLKTSTDAVTYKGVIPYEKSVETLRDYYALLFPTYWSGEGFAGTIIDAFASAIPVIATDWNMNSEIVPNMECGIVYPCDGIKTLEDAILWAVNNTDKFGKMKLNCLNEANKYDADLLMEKLIGYIK